MAYGLRLRIEYKDINGVDTQVNIYQDGYSGTADVRYAHAGLRITWGDESNPDPLIYGSSCTLFFDAEFDFEFLYLFSSDAKKHKVEIKKNGSFFWLGFIEPDSWSEPMRTTPYPVQCTAYDGLGFLRDVDYVTHPDARQTIASIFDAIMENTGLTGLTVNRAVGFAEEDGAEYYEHLIDDTIYDGLSCYEVIGQLFANCMLYQRSGAWYIWDWAKLNDWGATIADPQFEGTPELKILPALKKQTVVYDLGYTKNIVVNGSFDEFNRELAAFEGWDNVNVSPAQQILNNDGDKYVFVDGWVSTEAMTDYIKKSMAVVQTTSTLNVSLKYAIQGIKFSAYCRIAIVLRTAAKYYKLEPKALTDRNLEWEWVEYPLATALTGISAAWRMQRTNGTIEVEGVDVTAYEPVAEEVTAWPRNKITDHFEEFRASVAGIPEDGTLEIYLGVPDTNAIMGPSINGACYTAVAVELLDEENQEYPTEITFDVPGDVKNNFVPDDIKLLNGDYQLLIDNHKLIYKGGFTRPDTTETTGWKIYGTGTTFYPYAEFIGRTAAARMITPRQQMKARLMDVVPPMICIFADPNNPGFTFIETGITYDDRYQSIEGSFTEVRELDIDAPDVEGLTTYAFGVKMPNIAIPVPINIEERVIIRDRTGAPLSMPGYLYENDFEVRPLIPAENSDGFTRLQIKERGVTPYNLSHDASTVQFAVTSVFTANVDGNANKISISAGKLISHNFNAGDKDHRAYELGIL